MTTTSGGNLSIRDENGDVWITPARVDKGSLRRDDIVCVHAGGSVTGPHRPSSEYPFHAAIYAARSALRSLVHAHPVALVAFSICRLVPNVRALHEGASNCGQTGLAQKTRKCTKMEMHSARTASDRVAKVVAKKKRRGLPQKTRKCTKRETHLVDRLIDRST